MFMTASRDFGHLGRFEKPSSLCLRVGWRSLRRALASIWRMRSRVTSYWCRLPSSVRG